VLAVSQAHPLQGDGFLTYPTQMLNPIEYVGVEEEVVDRKAQREIISEAFAFSSSAGKHSPKLLCFAFATEQERDVIT
jgi:hypothetical protein